MPLTVRPEPTPNPNAVRFTLSAAVLGERPRTISSAEAARGLPWAERVFEIPGVQSVFTLRDFLTVTKASGVEWGTIVERVSRILSTDLQA